MSEKAGQFARKAEGWSETAYAAPDAYLAHRAELVATLGVALAAGDEVLDLACGDGGLGPHLLARGLAYRGVDNEPAMVEAASRLLGAAASVERGDLDTYEPPAPVATTTSASATWRSPARSCTWRAASANRTIAVTLIGFVHSTPPEGLIGIDPPMSN